jgi:hypothetical protein
MSQTGLNLIAIGVFTITLFSLLGPLINLSPVFPATVTGIILGLATIDTFGWENQGTSILLHLFISDQQRQRIVHHEAGHFLVAYYLGIPVKDYILNPWSAWRKGYYGRGGVVFDLENETKLDNLCTVWLAGIAAETIIYGDAEGGKEDKQQVSIALKNAGIPLSQQQHKFNLAMLRAKLLLQEHQKSYQTLVTAMKQGLSVAECYKLIQ